MSKHHLTRIFFVTVVSCCLGIELETPTTGQETQQKPGQESGQESASEPTEELPGAVKLEPVYPLAVAVEGDSVFVVDLDLPGVWRIDLAADPPVTSLFIRGSHLLRKPMNRPRCVTLHPAGGILVGDSPSREVYHFEGPRSKPTDESEKGLTNAHIGIPMALAVSPDKKSVYVGDAEKRATFRVPLEGGKPELVARVNARGLAFDSEGMLWAVTPDADAVVRINVETGEVTPVVTGRPFQYANGLCWVGDHGYVTDGYAKTIWKFTADGKTQKWHEGEPLVGPVGITATEDSLFVADPKQKQVYEFDRKTKKPTPRLP